MRLLACLFIFASLFVVNAGVLEDFEEDLKFLVDSYKEVKKSAHSSSLKVEYSKRYVRAKDGAARMQRDLEKRGVRNTSLDTTLTNMLAFISVEGVTSRPINIPPGSMNTYRNELFKQIKFLKEINYSFENPIAPVDPYPESNAYDAISKFESLLKQTLQLVSGSSSIDASFKKTYEANYKDLRVLAGEISREIVKRKFAVPSGFNLEDNLTEFNRAAAKVILMRGRMDPKDRKRASAGKNFKDSVDSAKFSANRMVDEIAYLRKANFRLWVQKGTLKRSAAPPLSGTDEITEETLVEKLPFETLWNRYNQKKDQLFQSESRIRGATKAFYDKYRALLTPEQGNEMDTLYQDAVRKELPPEFARASAVKAMHTKYKFKRDAYSAEFLSGILKK